MTDIDRLIGTPEASTAFPTLEEVYAFTHALAEKHPERVRLRTLGESTGGRPIHELEIGSGRRAVIVVGNPHPNEPIGLLTVKHLATRLAENPELLAELDATWHFVPCIDPDGTELNAGWYGGPLTRTNMGRNFYRTPKERQAEWTFPVEWRGRIVGSPVPETKALMTLIDETRPAFISSLHNAEFGGGHYYVNNGDVEYWSELISLLEDNGVPVDNGRPDDAGARTLATGVFELPPVQTFFDLASEDDPDAADHFSGGGPSDYTARSGTAVLISELPLWSDPRSTDGTPGTWRFADVVAEAARRYRADAAIISGILERLNEELPQNDPRHIALLQSIPGNGTILDARAKAVANEDRLANRAEEFAELHGLPDMMRMRLGGMLTHLLDAAHATGASARVDAEREAFRTVFTEWCDEIEAERPGTPIPLERLVRIQTGALLLSVMRLRDEMSE